MHKAYENVCMALDELAQAVQSSSGQSMTLYEIYGWNHPAITGDDLSDIPSLLAKRIRETDPDIEDTWLIEKLNDVPRKLKLLQTNTISYMFNGNGTNAIPAYLETLGWLQHLLDPILGWQVVKNNKFMPAQLVRRLRSLQLEIDELTPNKDALSAQIKLIHDATEAAESLPTDLQSLKEANKKVESLSNDSVKLHGQIESLASHATEFMQHISSRSETADKLVEQCEDAYRITTTKGLAAAFDQRAERLSSSMWIWVVGLLISLFLGTWVGSKRIEILSNALSTNEPQWSIIVMHIVLSLLSVGAPFWFAWIATKQIGQRFRLAEDYAFKASVAKAYEGYRKEASRIDQAFEARLFSSALSRLEEAPLRLVEGISHGSPWHELITSEAFQKAMASVPELKKKFIDLAKNNLSSEKKNDSVE